MQSAGGPSGCIFRLKQAEGLGSRVRRRSVTPQRALPDYRLSVEGRYPLPVGPMQRSTIWYRDMLPESPTGTATGKGTDTEAPTSRGPGNTAVGDRPDSLRVTEVTPSLAERSGARWVLRPVVIYLASRVVTM